MKSIGIISLLIIFSGCSGNKEVKFISTELTPIDTMVSVDQEFFRWVKDIRKTENGFSFIDRQNQTAFIVDKDFNLIKSFGEKGKGPREFIGLVSAFYQNGNLKMIDTETGKIISYNIKKDIITEANLKDLTVLHTRIAYGPEDIYAQALPAQKVIKKINTASEISRSFGNAFDSDEIREVFSRSHRHLVTQDGARIYSIWYSEPVIEIYDKQGTLLQAYDYVNSGYFDERLKYMREQVAKDPNNRFKTYTLFEDAYIYENALYILFAGSDNNNRYTTNEIIVFDLRSDQLQPLKKITLKGSKAYGSICVWEDGIVAFDNTSGAFHLYSM